MQEGSKDIRGHTCTVYLEDFVDKFNCSFIGEPLPESVTRDDNEPTTATASTNAPYCITV